MSKGCVHQQQKLICATTPIKKLSRTKNRKEPVDLLPVKKNQKSKTNSDVNLVQVCVCVKLNRKIHNSRTIPTSVPTHSPLKLIIASSLNTHIRDLSIRNTTRKGQRVYTSTGMFAIHTGTAKKLKQTLYGVFTLFATIETRNPKKTPFL